MTGREIDALPGDGGTYRDDRVKELELRDGKRVKTWYVVKKVSGVVLRIKLGCYPELGISAARTAAIAEITKQTQKKQNTISNTQDYTLREVFELWADAKEGNRKSIPEDRRRMEKNLAALGAMSIYEITADTLEEQKRVMKNTPVLFNRCMGLLSCVYTFARRKLHMKVDNVTEEVERFPEFPRARKISLDHAPAFFASLRHASQHVQDLVNLFLYCGPRKGNLYAMRWDELDLSAGAWHIPGMVSKNGLPMPTALPKEAVAILRRRKAECKPGAVWVFPAIRPAATGRTPGPGHITSIDKALATVCRRANCPVITPHDFRRSFGSWMISAGGSIEQVSKNLHHSDIKVTQKVYAETAMEYAREGVEKLARLIDAEKAKSISSDNEE